MYYGDENITLSYYTMMIYTSARPQHVPAPFIGSTEMEELHRFLKNYQNTAGALPTVRQIMRYLGFRSTNSVYKHLKALERAGRLLRSKGRLSLPVESKLSIPFLGGVAAGFAAPAEEAGMDVLSLDEFMIHHPERTFLLTVKGDSMKDAGIMIGDYVLVERGQTPHHGKIVVACIDGGFTLKYFMKENGKVFLRSANPAYPDFYPKEELQIMGSVVGVMRKLAL